MLSLLENHETPKENGVDTSESNDRILIYGQSLNEPNGIDFSNKLDVLDFELGPGAIHVRKMGHVRS